MCSSDLGGSIVANGVAGNDGQVLTTNGSAVYWGNVSNTNIPLEITQNSISANGSLSISSNGGGFSSLQCMSDENNNGYSELYWYTGNNTPQPSWGIFSDLYVERDGMWLENGQYDEANNYVQSQWRWRMDGITEFPNRITFNQSVGYYPPDFYNKTGEKITLWDETGGDYSYAIGVEQNSMWFGVDAGGDINKGFKWYHGGSSVMDLSRAGVLNVSYITSVSMTIDQINAPDTLILQPSGVNYFINSTSISIPGSITFSDNTTQNTAFIPSNYANKIGRAHV